LIILTHLLADLMIENLRLSFSQCSLRNPFVIASLKEEEHVIFCCCCSLTIFREALNRNVKKNL